MELFQIALSLSVFLCSLVTGFLFSYAVVVMPGIRNLNDRDFIQAFQVTDRIIQNNQPIFLLVWVGSAISIIISAVYGIGRLQGTELVLISISSIMYTFGVQALTIAIHLPLNNKLQSLDIDEMKPADLQAARIDFETRWNTYNLLRTVIAACVSVLLIILIYRL